VTTAPGSHSLTGRLREELRDYAIVAGYLYLCLGACVEISRALGPGVLLRALRSSRRE
jgi:hypothetical protein